MPAQFWSKNSGKKPGEATQLSPETLLELLAPSIIAVECLGPGGQLVRFGSGVVIAPASVVTNKHLVEQAAVINIKSCRTVKLRHNVESRRRIWRAQITHLHPDHDLCQLHVEGLDASPIPRGIASTVRVGQRVFAIGSPLGFALTISDGLISGLRRLQGEDIIQMSALISGGSSGGGLCDSKGRLIGITTSAIGQGQNPSFALPAKLIRKLGSHRADPAGRSMAKATKAAVRPTAAVHARLEIGFPEATFTVYPDGEKVIHVSWHGAPSEEQVRKYLHSLVLRRKLPDPQFEFERVDS